MYGPHRSSCPPQSRAPLSIRNPSSSSTFNCQLMPWRSCTNSIGKQRPSRGAGPPRRLVSGPVPFSCGAATSSDRRLRSEACSDGRHDSTHPSLARPMPPEIGGGPFRLGPYHFLRRPSSRPEAPGSRLQKRRHRGRRRKRTCLLGSSSASIARFPVRIVATSLHR